MRVKSKNYIIIALAARTQGPLATHSGGLMLEIKEENLKIVS